MAEYDAVTARNLLERAIGMTTKPTLAEADVELLLSVSGIVNDDESVSYTSAKLNEAAALAWEWKSNMLTDQYDLGGGNGKYLTRSQWFNHCNQRSTAYRLGTSTVDGIATRSGFGVIAISGPLAGEY